MHEPLSANCICAYMYKHYKAAACGQSKLINCCNDETYGSYVVIICCFLLQFSNIAQKCYFFIVTSYFGILIVVCLTIIVCFECYSSHVLYNC